VFAFSTCSLVNRQNIVVAGVRKESSWGARNAGVVGRLGCQVGKGAAMS